MDTMRAAIAVPALSIDASQRHLDAPWNGRLLETSSSFIISAIHEARAHEDEGRGKRVLSHAVPGPYARAATMPKMEEPP